MQTPPPYSAVKYKGKPLYHYARRGVKVEVNPRPIKIHDVQLRTYDQETLRVIISCSRGTYARVLAGEIAKALGSTGHLAALSRLRSGPFHLEDAVSMADLAEMVAATPGHDWASVLLSRKAREERVKWRSREDVWQALTPHLVSPVHALAHLPLIDIDDTQAQLVRIGTASFQVPFGVPLGGRMLVAKGADVIAVAENQRQGAKILRVMGDSAKRRRRGR